MPLLMQRRGQRWEGGERPGLEVQLVLLLQLLCSHELVPFRWGRVTALMPVRMKRVRRGFYAAIMGRKSSADRQGWISSVLQDASSVFGSARSFAAEAWI